MEYLKNFLHVEGTIGQGAFGRVLQASPIINTHTPPSPPRESDQPSYIKSANENGPKFAIKCVHPILKPLRLANELRHLRDLGGQCNVVQMHTAHFNMGSLFIVMELIERDRFMDYVYKLDYCEIVSYMKNLLIALEHVHSKNIMHRDIKPANFLYNRKDKKFLLVDFGLAQIVRSSTNQHQQLTKLGSPIRQTFQYITLTPTSSPNAPNVSTKRHLPDPHKTNDFSQMLKKLRVSSNTREPVKLTVEAYESPVTHTDSGSRRNNLINHKQQKLATPLAPARKTPGPRCDCRGKPKTCSICMSRPEPTAPKSGTPGFKAPEILLRYMNQSTAIDIWSAGIIMLYLLSGHAPFFRDVEDVVGLAEIVTILGSQRVTHAARAIGVRLNIEPKREPMDLAQLCRTIRKNSPEKRKLEIPDSAFDLLKKMLDPNPLTRITASDALKHPWLKSPDEAA